MRKILIAAFVAAIAAVAGVMTARLSTDALAMIVGVVLGLAALIPTLILTVLMLRRKDDQAEDHMRPPMYHQPQPPVVVVSGGGYPQMMPQMQGAMNGAPAQAMIPAPPAQRQREFRMMGYESTDAIELREDEWAAYA